MTRGMRKSSDPGATELEPVRRMTSGNVLNGKAMTHNDHNNQVILSQILETTLPFGMIAHWKTGNEENKGCQQT